MTHPDLIKLEADHPDWVIWRGVRSDGTPGDYYANRRTWRATLPEGASLTVVGTTIGELAAKLWEQAAREGAYGP